MVAYEIHVNDCIEAEKAVHTLLEHKGHRLSPNKEFFNAPLPHVIDAMLQIKKQYQGKQNNFDDAAADDQDINESFDSDLQNNLLNELLEEGDQYQYGWEDKLEDKDEAMELYRKAANLGSSEAYYRMGDMILNEDMLNGENVYHYSPESFKYFKEGAKKGSGNCYASMADAYLELGQKDNAVKCFKQYFSSKDFQKSLNSIHIIEKDHDPLETPAYIFTPLYGAIEYIWNFESTVPVKEFRNALDDLAPYLIRFCKSLAEGERKNLLQQIPPTWLNFIKTSSRNGKPYLIISYGILLKNRSYFGG